MGLFRRNADKAIEAEIQNLRTRLDGVRARLAAAETKAEQAVAEQRALLSGADVIDAAAARKAGDACRRAQDDLAAHRDAERALSDLLTEAESRLAAERDQREREAAAKACEARAARIRTAADALEQAARNLDAVRLQTLDVIEADAARDPLTGAAPTYGLLRAAAHVAGVAPVGEGEAFCGVPTTIAAAVEPILATLTSEAATLRAGSGPVAVRPEAPTLTAAAIFREVVVVLMRPAFYRARFNHRIDLPAGGVTVPEPIAQRALAMGVGFERQSRQGQDILRILAAQPNARIEPSEDDAGFRGVAFSGVLGERGDQGEARKVVGMAPALPPADLGSLPDLSGVILPGTAA